MISYLIVLIMLKSAIIMSETVSVAVLKRSSMSDSIQFDSVCE